jgi:hypothetical protein
MKTETNLLNAITEAVREIERCPDDSMQDIFNEALTSWRTGLKMNHRYEIEKDDVAAMPNISS